MKKIINFCIWLSFVASQLTYATTLSEFSKRPKLVVMIVIDQFRADYLTRFQNQFLPAEKNQKLGGFKFLMDKSAYFPFAQYDVFQNMTCPGHAMISTGSRPYLNGIALNDYYDRQENKIVYCVDDDKDDVSPRRLNSTTFGDEIKNAGVKSKIFSLALKDRSAVMLGGHRADLALWMDYKNFQWRTSSFYAQDLPAWLKIFNQKIGAMKNDEVIFQDKKVKLFSRQGLSIQYGIDQSFLLAEEIIKNEKLGQTSNLDVLALSLSTHDMLGHFLGPNASELEKLTLYEDQRLSQFLNTLKKQLGSLKDVEIVLTADHGVAPTVDYAQKAKFSSDKLDYLQLYKKINERLDEKFGSVKKSWIAASKTFHFYFDQSLLKEKKLNSSEVEIEAKKALEGLAGVHMVLLRSDLLKGVFPPGELGEQVKRQFAPGISGDFIIVPKTFFMEKDDNTTTHMTGYSYDRTVPVIFFGAKFKPGVYSTPAKVIDIAPTLNFSLGVLPPASSEGQVLPIF